MNAYIGSQEDLERDGWIYEPKLDGFRALCYVTPTGYKLLSRNKDVDLTDRYMGMHFRKNIKAKHAVIDGEITALNDQGLPEFNLLTKGNPATFFVFDILMVDGKNLTNVPLIERKKILEKVVRNGNGIQKNFYTHNGKQLWKKVVKYNIEGVMAKDDQSLYYPGLRKKIWLKIKRLTTVDCVIVGFYSKVRSISSLALGLYKSDHKLHLIGVVGTGFNTRELEDLETKLSKIVTKKRPTIEDDPRVTWVKPKYVCEVKLLEFGDGYIRHSSFIRMRPDKKPKQCTFAAQIPQK